MADYLLLFLSAFSGASAFVWPSYCCWLIFLFMIPLFLFALYFPQCMTWKSGLLWGIAFFGLHSHWIVVLMYQKSQAPIAGLIVALLFIGFCAVHAGIWFAATAACAKLYKLNGFNTPQLTACSVRPELSRSLSRAESKGVRTENLCSYGSTGSPRTDSEIADTPQLAAGKFIPAWLPALMLASTAIVFWSWVDHCIFWITGQCDGYPMAFPLVPLAQIPQFLAMAPWLSMTGLLICLVAFSLSGALFLYYKKIAVLFIALLCLLPFLIGFVLPGHTGALAQWASTVGYLTAPCQQYSDPYENGRCIGKSLLAYRALHPQVRLIIMPESTCPFAVNEYPCCISLWDASLMHDDCILIVGGHESAAGNLYNTIYCICKGNIIARHHKTHCFPLVEHIPAPWSRIPCIYSLFLSGYCPFSAGDQPDQIIQIDDRCCFIPMICSELFFATHAHPADRQIPVLCIINDSWFIPSMRYLLFLEARCKAVLWQRAILYVGHYGAFWIKPDGSRFSVGTIANYDANPV